MTPNSKQRCQNAVICGASSSFGLIAYAVCQSGIHFPRVIIFLLNPICVLFAVGATIGVFIPTKSIWLRAALGVIGSMVGVTVGIYITIQVAKNI